MKNPIYVGTYVRSVRKGFVRLPSHYLEQHPSDPWATIKKTTKRGFPGLEFRLNEQTDPPRNRVNVRKGDIYLKSYLDLLDPRGIQSVTIFGGGYWFYIMEGGIGKLYLDDLLETVSRIPNPERLLRRLMSNYSNPPRQSDLRF